MIGERRVHPTHQYALDITSGEIGCAIGRYERLACERHLSDVERSASDDFPYIFDETRADRVFYWFENICRHVDGVYSGETITLLPHQKFDLGCIFGWVRKDTGARRFKKVYKKVGRGNAKSAEMSAISNYFMCSDVYYPPYQPELARRDGRPQVECAATDREQAKIVLDAAKAMANASEDILEHLSVKNTYVTHKEYGGHMRALSKDTKNKNGLNPDLVTVDEYHEHPTSFIVDVCESSFGKKVQNLMVIITTAGINAENSPCRIEEEHLYKPILDGVIKSDKCFVIIREYDTGDDPHDLSLLTKANPMLRVKNEYSEILLREIIDYHNEAYDSQIPDKIREFLTKRCNLWQEGSEDKYMTAELMDKWKSLAVSREEFKNLVRGTVTINGNDASKCEDLTASANVHILDNKRIGVTAMGFIPTYAVERHEKSDRVPYKSWAKDGWCTITAGEVTDTAYLEKYIAEYGVENAVKIQEVCCDSTNLLYFMNSMTDKGYTPIEVRQGKMSLSEATKLFRNLVLSGKIVHDGNPLLAWCIGNAYQEQDSNENIKLSKKNISDTQRIDLIAAVINAMTRYVAQTATTSVYEERGIRAI